MLTKKVRLLAVCLAALFCLVLLSSTLFIAVEADHDCTGEDCAICYQLSVCGNVLKTLGTIDLTAAVAVFAACGTAVPLVYAVSRREEDTPVSLRVKLSN